MLQLMSLLNLQYVVYIWKTTKAKKTPTWNASVHIGIVQEGPVMWIYELKYVSCLWSIYRKMHKQPESENLWSELLMLSWSLRTHGPGSSVSMMGNETHQNDPNIAAVWSHLPHFPAVGSVSSPMWSHHSAGQAMQLGSQCKTIGESRTLYSL